MTYAVAATEEIRQPNSLIAQFLRAEFPVLDDLAADFQRQLHGAATLAPDAPGPDYPWAMVGTAIDYRLRFLFEVVPVTGLQAFRSARGFQGGDRGTALAEQVSYSYGVESRYTVHMPRVSAKLFTVLRAFLRRVRPARRSLSRDDEAWLCRYCAALTLVGTKLLRRLGEKTHPLHTLPPGATLDDLFGLLPREDAADLCRLFRQFETGTGRTWLRQPVTFDPHVWVGNVGASPDVLVGNSLLDVKTTIRPRIWLDLLLLYVLAVGNRKDVHHLGLHLVRQDRTIAWPIDEFVARVAGYPDPDVERLSQAFFDVAARSSRLHPQERWRAQP